MSGQEVFVFAFGVFVTLICIGPFLIIPFMEDDEEKD